MSYYGTLAKAETYFDTRLDTESWDEATNINKIKALTMATRAIDRLNFIGEKVDNDQELEFPRNFNDAENEAINYFEYGGYITYSEDYDMNVMPEDIENACYEIALALLNGKDAELEFESANLTITQMGPIQGNFDTNTPEYILSGIVSYYAWQFLKPYLRDSRTMKVFRTS